jgi:hypothetical protein
LVGSARLILPGQGTGRLPERLTPTVPFDRLGVVRVIAAHPAAGGCEQQAESGGSRESDHDWLLLAGDTEELAPGWRA